MVAATAVDGGICKTFSTMGIGFGYNNPKFSDRILRIEITAEDSHHSKESPSRVTTVHISSLVLASQSPFFYKMFSNGMKESEQEVVDLTAHASEELALMDLLQFLYKNTLEATTHEDLLKVLILADKYQVDSCVTHCAQALSRLSMTFEVAMSCINLPSSVLESDNTHLRSLMDAATCFLSKEFTEHHEAALELPLESIEKLLSWDSLEVDCEDDVYDFVTEWMSTHYDDINERRRVFSSQLLHLIRLPYMSCDKLKHVLDFEEFEQGEATKMVVETLLSMLENGQALPTSSCPMRAYQWLPVVVTTLDRPYKECIVYAELKKEDCYSLAGKTDGISTQDFYVGNEFLYLEFIRSPSIEDDFGVLLWQHHWSESESSADRTMSVKVAMRLKSTGKFVTKQKHKWAIGLEERFWCGFGSWGSFSANDQYFYDGVFYVRINLRPMYA